MLVFDDACERRQLGCENNEICEQQICYRQSCVIDSSFSASRRRNGRSVDDE